MTNNIPQETINTLLVDILTGAKEASSEIYGASKISVIKAIDFAQEQSPLVVQEFLAWKFAQATIFTATTVIALIVITFLIKKCFSDKWVEKTEGASNMFGLFGIILWMVIVSCKLAPNVEQMVKIKAAPRVYVIEWVSDLIKSNNRRNP